MTKNNSADSFGKPLIENSLKYSQKIYSNKMSNYNNFIITNNAKTMNLTPYT